MKQLLSLTIILLLIVVTAPHKANSFAESFPIAVGTMQQVKIYKFETRHNQNRLIELFKDDNDVLHWIFEGYTTYVYTNTNVTDTKISNMLNSHNVNFNFLGSTLANRDSKRFKK